jgi:hypothetical protein
LALSPGEAVRRKRHPKSVNAAHALERPLPRRARRNHSPCFARTHEFDQAYGFDLDEQPSRSGEDDRDNDLDNAEEASGDREPQ